MKNQSRLIAVVVFIQLCVILPFIAAAATTKAPTNTAAATSQTSEQPPASVAETGPTRRSSILAGWLHILDQEGAEDDAVSSVLSFAPQVPSDLLHILRKTGGDNGLLGFLGVLLRSAVAIGIGFLAMSAFRKLTRTGSSQLERSTPPTNDGWSNLWAGVLRALPAVARLLVLSIFSIAIFLLLARSVTVEGRMLFQLLLGAFLSYQVVSIIGRIIFAPEDGAIRPIELLDSLAKALHYVFIVAMTTLLSGMLLVNFIRELGAYPQTVSWVVIILGTIVIGIFGYLVLFLREPLSRTFADATETTSTHWFRQQMASYWHLPALLYLIFVWFIWIGREITGAHIRNGAFLVSLAIGPIYFIFNYFGSLIINSVVESLGIGRTRVSKAMVGLEEPESEAEIASRKKIITDRSCLVFRLVLIAALVTWLLSLWGVDLPFAVRAVRAIFESLVALALALLCWRFFSDYIERKIAEVTHEPAVQTDDVDDEFGGAAPRGRSQTLLPMLRKVIGSVLVVMVVLIVLSALGVNIGPLLAGAGVVGLAVGFGAQKLVHDILSGFFFLLDDAFRVGEYIQAGKIKGTVEAITLRNVMLRHHLGMLQVIPHSDLGTVTNFMRGGIVIKFPLEFPYDTSIDLVRRIIKKVGQQMLEDEEMCDDFIQPLKSQGVYEIANSVMVIRVKFTAKPGKQFLIKREAFRRITEALNAKGIYYAHRKFIVDFPDDHPHDNSERTRQKEAQAGAVAAAIQQEEEEKKKLLEQSEESE